MQNSDMNVRYIIVILQAPKSLLFFFFLFQSVFSLLFKLDKFDVSVIKLSDSFLYPFHSDVEPIHRVFYVNYFIFQF